jgi:UDP-N-acetylglucosamine diphosphorylase/glucosamine-1-phosphate N-acetyltransferase
MKAVILAAGEGRRLEPLTDTRPKPMLPVANRPLLEHVVESVVAAGIEEIVLVVGYKRKRIQSHFGDGDDWGIDIEYAIQRKQLGTGHAVLQAEGLVDDTFLVLNGDRIIDPSIVERAAEAEEDGETLVGVIRTEDPSGLGVVETDGERVTGVTEKPPEHAITSEIVNAGVYRFDPGVFDVIRGTDTSGELTITATLDRLAAGGTVRALRYRGAWLDVSHLWDLLSVNGSLLDGDLLDVPETARVGKSAVITDGVAVGSDVRIGPSATVLSGTSVGDNASIGANAVVDNAVILPDAAVGAGAVLKDCVVGENTEVGPNTTVAGGPADVIVDGVVHGGVKLGGVVGDNARIGGAVSIYPGTVIGNRTTVEGGASVDGRIASGAEVRRG